MPSESEVRYFLGFDGGGTKTECLLANAEGKVVARSIAGASNPLRTGYTRAWFALGEAADAVLRRQKIRAHDVSAVCAGIGGAGRPGVAKRIAAFLAGSFPNARIGVITDLDIALEAAFDGSEGILLLAGTGSACFGREANGRTARAGGRGPWFSDEGSAFDIGRRAFVAVTRAEEHRGAETALSKRLSAWHQCQNWDTLLERIAKNPDDIFPQTFPLVGELADRGDAVSREILVGAAKSLAELARCVANELGWINSEIRVAKAGGVHGRSKYFDAAIDSEIKKALPAAQVLLLEMSPAQAAVRVAIRAFASAGNAA